MPTSRSRRAGRRGVLCEHRERSESEQRDENRCKTVCSMPSPLRAVPALRRARARQTETPFRARPCRDEVGLRFVAAGRAAAFRGKENAAAVVAGPARASHWPPRR